MPVGAVLAAAAVAAVGAGYLVVGPMFGGRSPGTDVARVEPPVLPGVEEPLPPEPDVAVAPTPPTPAPAAPPDPPPLPQPESPPRPQPEPTPPPAPAPPPPSSPEPPLSLAPAPPPPTASPPAQPPNPADGPPPTVRLSAEEQPIPGNPVASLSSTSSKSVDGAQEGKDITYLLELARRHGRGDGGGRAATIARALRMNAWWYSHRPAPTRRTLVVDPDGIIYTYRRGHGFAVNPVATTGRWRGLNEAVPAEKLAETLLPLGVTRRAKGRTYLAWEYFDLGDRPGVIRPGLSGMAQARIAELMANAYRSTGEVRFARAARQALVAFTIPVDDGGVRAMVAYPAGRRPSPWYVERAYPGESPWKGAALNGFMVSVLNLRGTAAQLRTGAREQSAGSKVKAVPEANRAADLARSLADAGARTLVRYIPLHDTGSWSYYGMLTPGRPWRTYLADLNYHCYHVALLRQLAVRYPERSFERTARKWQGYVDRSGQECPPR